MKTATLTFHRAWNYGAVLQSYALNKALTALGFENEIVDYECDAFRKNYVVFNPSGGAKGLVSAVLHMPDRMRRKKIFGDFRREYLNMTEPIEKSGLRDLSRRFDAVITGSDQVFNPEQTGDDAAYFLDFAVCRKISYAASLGTADPNPNQQSFYREYLPSFSAVSVREQSGADILKDVCHVDAETVADPVFLLSRGEWEERFIDKKPPEKPYIFAYCLHEHNVYRCADELKRQTGLDIICVADGLRARVDGKCIKAPSVGEFLNLIYHAEYVVTDSFHVSAFSVIFEKNLKIVLKSAYQGLNDRLVSLAESLNLRNCIVDAENLDDLARETVFDNTAALLYDKIKQSKDFIVHSLS